MLWRPARPTVPQNRRRACFDTALAFLGGFGSPFGVILGNHDLEGAEFQTDQQNLAAWHEARLSCCPRERGLLSIAREAALMVHQLDSVRGCCCMLRHQHPPDMAFRPKQHAGPVLQAFRQSHFWAERLGPVLCVGLSTVRFRSNEFSVHEVRSRVTVSLLLRRFQVAVRSDAVDVARC